MEEYSFLLTVFTMVYMVLWYESLVPKFIPICECPFRKCLPIGIGDTLKSSKKLNIVEKYVHRRKLCTQRIPREANNRHKQQRTVSIISLHGPIESYACTIKETKLKCGMTESVIWDTHIIIFIEYLEKARTFQIEVKEVHTDSNTNVTNSKNKGDIYIHHILWIGVKSWNIAIFHSQFCQVK